MKTKNLRIDTRKNHIQFFLSVFLSAFGYEFIVAVMTLHVYDLRKSALETGIFTALAFVPKLFSSLMGGLADRFGKAKCFAVCAVLTSVMLAELSFVRNMLLLYALWLLTSFFLTFIVNVRSSLMAEIVSLEQFAAGNSRTLFLLSAARLVGPLLAGYSAMHSDLQPLLLAICVLYLVVGVLCAFIRVESERNTAQPGIVANAKEGLRFVLSNPTFRMLTLVGFFWRLFLGMQLSLFVIYIKSTLGGDSQQYGLFLALIGGGSILGSMLGRLYGKQVISHKRIVMGVSVHYASFIALGFVQNYYLALAIAFLSYAAFYMTLVGIHSARDNEAPSAIRSSAYGTVTAILTPATILSMLLGGYLANHFSASAILIGAGVLALCSLYAVVFGVSRKRANPVSQAQ